MGMLFGGFWRGGGGGGGRDRRGADWKGDAET